MRKHVYKSQRRQSFSENFVKERACPQSAHCRALLSIQHHLRAGIPPVLESLSRWLECFQIKLQTTLVVPSRSCGQLEFRPFLRRHTLLSENAHATHSITAIEVYQLMLGPTRRKLERLDRSADNGFVYQQHTLSYLSPAFPTAQSMSAPKIRMLQSADL